MNIIFHKDVEDYLSELVGILYTKEYFGFEESAIEYVDKLIDDIVTNLHKKLKKPAPKQFSKYGKNLKYVTYRRNKNTSWYVFFEFENNTYYVNYIANNHTVSQHL
ncbi:hypothetical protein [Dysgonomonas sp. 25]|uniref:hypothetical protein n=1 Tax=Dysgonomonas sp. 25 TaxID=2302933 RepID=UPI0013D7B113|nr:hypothetical protein [Dysgonomonas sp. 25]NDV68198.1 hypothetical protein [Dysgonomonas sp. 25]